MLDKLCQSIRSALPPELKEDIKNNVEAVVRSNFEKMNLVTRDQLEVQEKILKRTRGRVGELEKKLQELERTIAQSGK
ncbi:MAG: accessory factor UbiK family protein [Gammaproteobacteria bacterium]|nr:accessory factor UbiK family protein [Gammaproteobacteria bacterium]